MDEDAHTISEDMAQPFIVFPAIDLRGGKVVRLKEGDPVRQTSYSTQPKAVAERWLSAGASWLHVINLDGAFGQNDTKNVQALTEIVDVANQYHGSVQFGGGLRDEVDIIRAFDLGVSRTILGTLAINRPHSLPAVLQHWGSERIAVSLDARNESVKVHGWQQETSKNVFSLAREMQKAGLEWLIYTDIRRDGMLSGINLETSLLLAQRTGLKVIASGGVKGEEDILAAGNSGLAGIIVGRALYEGAVDYLRLWNDRSNSRQTRSE